jgi:hypothetical protein
MVVSFAAIALLCICSASALGFSIVLGFFLLMWCGCCRVSDDDLNDSVRHGGELAPEVERKGIPLGSKPPRLTPEQQQLRDKALEKYKRRKAREERRRARQAAREARAANRREGDYDDDGGDGGGHGGSEYDDGESSVTSRTTLASHATTVRTASTAAYGRGAYLLPPPHLCGVDMEEGEVDGSDRGSEVRSVHSRSSHYSSSSTKSKTSQGGGGGTMATIKSYMRHRQRQRLRRREEQQQLELFNQWAEAQMATSSELSPSSKSSSVSSVGSDSNAKGNRNSTTNRRHRSGAGAGGSMRGGRGRRQPGTLDSSVNTQCLYHNGGGFDYWQPSPSQQQPRRSNSVASSAPRPPEEILGDDHTLYSFMAGEGGEAGNYQREQLHLKAGYPALPNTFFVQAGFGPPAGNGKTGKADDEKEEGKEEGSAAVPHTHTPANTSLHADPQQYQLPAPRPPRRTKRTWKDVEHNVALSGFFSSPANNSFGGVDIHHDDGEAPAPFHSTSAEPSHSPLGYPRQPRE